MVHFGPSFLSLPPLSLFLVLRIQEIERSLEGEEEEGHDCRAERMFETTVCQILE